MKLFAAFQMYLFLLHIVFRFNWIMTVCSVRTGDDNPIGYWWCYIFNVSTSVVITRNERRPVHHPLLHCLFFLHLLMTPVIFLTTFLSNRRFFLWSCWVSLREVITLFYTIEIKITENLDNKVSTYTKKKHTKNNRCQLFGFNLPPFFFFGNVENRINQIIIEKEN